MTPIYLILDILFILLAIGLMVVILLQKKSSQGLGSISGMGSADTYWDRNKSRSIEGALEKYTRIGGVVFFLFSIVLCVIR